MRQNAPMPCWFWAGLTGAMFTSETKKTPSPKPLVEWGKIAMEAAQAAKAAKLAEKEKSWDGAVAGAAVVAFSRAVPEEPEFG